MDMQIENKDTGIDIICSEDNCVRLNYVTSQGIVSYLLHFLFSFHYAVSSLLVCCTYELMTTETRIQLIKSYYVTVVFLPQ